MENSKDKLKRKNLNLIVMNTLEDKGAGFAGDTNKISILDNHNNFTSFELKSKSEVATDIVEYMINYNS
jgi:phosphopantothenoylcysteine decarboxylase/phosphopantothenate--cysteine ligase